MDILLTNDDGVYAEGLWALYRRLVKNHSVTVVAPDRERSAISHGITLSRPLRASRITANGADPAHSINGTPADCIKLALRVILDKAPDLVISGINPGANVGINVNYSGTVAAAKEATLSGVRALAVSIASFAPQHYRDATAFIEKLARLIHQNGLPAGTFLNVNLPDIPMEETAGVRVSRQALEISGDGFDKRIDPRNRTYYWQGCDLNLVSENPEFDATSLRQKYISITPIKCDMTDYAMLDRLQGWNLAP